MRINYSTVKELRNKKMSNNIIEYNQVIIMVH